MQKIIFRTLFLSAHLFLFGSFPSWTQISSGLPSNMSGPVPDLSPNAEAARNVNVDLYHGVAHISIPLYQVSNKNATVPISLNYTPSTKADNVVYYPGWTGLGWSLSAGGTIVRIVRGVEDEKVRVNGNSLQLCEQCDPHEDLFIFNFCGYSGKFFYHKERWIVFDTETPNIVIYVNIIEGAAGGTKRDIKGFRLLFPNGFIYTFGSIDNSAGISWENSAWYLTRIESPEGDCLRFNYEQENNCVPRPVYNCTQYHAVNQHSSGNVYPGDGYDKIIPDSLNNPGSSSNLLPSAYASASPIFLQSITGGQVTVFFNRSAATEKSPPPPHPPLVDATSYQLNEIVFFDEETQRNFKKYQLTYTNDTTQILKLLSVQEQGIKADNSIANKPAYVMNYISKYVSFENPSTTLLQKMTYPTGGYTTFEYEYCQPDNVNYQMEMSRLYHIYNKYYSFRIKNIRSYGDENDVPSVTTYSYDNAVRSRSKRVYSNFEIYMPYDYFLHGNRASNYDQYIPTGYSVSKQGSFNYNAIITEPDETGYGYVGVTKHRGNQSESAGYIYAAYRLNNNTYPGVNVERTKYYKRGTLIRIDRSAGPKHSATNFDYMDPEWGADTVRHKWIEYFPFKISNNEYTYIKKDSAQFHYNFHPVKPTQIAEYPHYGTSYDSMRVTTFKYDRLTGKLRYKEKRDREGNVYRTEYRYYDENSSLLHLYAIRDYNAPFETVVKKNGKVISATVVHDTVVHQNSCAGGCPDIIRPKKVFVLASNTPIDDYQPADVASHNRQPDPRCKLATTYRYDSSGMPVRMQNTGEPPVLFEWDEYGRLVSRVEGAEVSELLNAAQGLPYNNTLQGKINFMNVLRKRLPNARITSYTYNIHGQTSVTDPTGYTRYAEYDAFGQPIVIKDDEGNIRQSNEYQYNINP